MNARELYWRALEQCRSVGKYADSKLKPIYCSLQQRNNQGVYAVHIHAKVGFFAQLNWCLEVFAHCDRFHLKPHIFLSSPFYTRVCGENWLDYYFDNPWMTEADKALLGNGTIKVSYVSDIEQLGLPDQYEAQLTLEYANTLIEKYLRLKHGIRDYVEAFVERQFRGKTVLGVHYRGTDKKSEANPVSWEYAAWTICNYLDANPHVDALFVASDEEAFVEWIRTKIRGVEVLFHHDAERSRDGHAVHVRPELGDNYLKGRDALVNCLLLSKCHALIRTSSFLSAWSSVFNPSLPVIMLNKPFDNKLWFPDRVIVKKSLNGSSL